MNPKTDIESFREILRDVFDDASLLISPATRKSEIAGWDSVETVRILVEMEERYGVRLSMSDVGALNTVQDFLLLIPEEAQTPEVLTHPRVPDTKIRVSIAGTSTTTFLKESLIKKAVDYGLHLELYEGLHGTLRKEIMLTESGLYEHQPRFIFLHTSWRDLQLPPLSQNPDQAVDCIVTEWLGLWDRIRTNCDAQIIQFAFDIPENTSEGQLGWLRKGGRSRIIHKVNLALAERAPDEVYWIASQQNASVKWTDEKVWLSHRQHPSHQAIPLLADNILHTMSAALGLSRKVLVLDLDNTLWGGIIGEDGVDGIELGSHSPAGEAYAAFQTYLKELKERGILLAVCSKNDPSRAMAPFEEHKDSVLKGADFIEFKANWKPKSENIIELADSLNLGLDSFVFVDDSPVECEEVSIALPEVRTICIEGDPSLIIPKIKQSGCFEAVVLSHEDIARNDAYQQNRARQHFETEHSDYDAFLQGLNMRLLIAEIETASLERAAQLINKTNQFNLSLKRRTTAELKELAGMADSYVRCAHLSDKFGSYGLIAILLALKGKDIWEIDTLLMSCRVFARGVEFALLQELIAEAESEGAKLIRARYVPSERNELIAGFLLECNFEGETTADGSIMWTLELSAYRTKTTFFDSV